MNGASPGDIGLWVSIAFGSGIALLTVVWLARQLWVSFNPPTPSRDGGREYVTRHELAESFDRLESRIGEFVTRTEYENRHEEVKLRLEALDKYLHERIHQVLDAIGAIGARIDVLTELLHREIGRREGATKKE